jgi:hypothetical protein
LAALIDLVEAQMPQITAAWARYDQNRELQATR